MLVFLLRSRFAFECSKLEFVSRCKLVLKLHKYCFDLLEVVSDCVDLDQHALVKIVRSLPPCFDSSTRLER